MRPEILTRIKSWLGGKPEPPFHIEIILTNKCNLSCIACLARGKAMYVPDQEKNMSLEIYKKILSEAAELDIKEVHLSGGGEPLTHCHIFEIMKEIKEHGMRGSMVTNGSLFDQDLIKGMVEIKWDNVLYSLDGPDAETHDTLRKEGVFDKVIDSVKKFNFYKKKHSGKYPVIEFCLVLSSYNYNKIHQYLDLASSLGVKKIFIQPIRVNNTGIGEKLKLTTIQKKEFKSLIPSLLKRSEGLGIETNLEEMDELLIKKSCEIKEVIERYSNQKEESKRGIDSLPCYSPWYFIGIRPNGDIYPCGVDADEPFGNVTSDSLKNIWYGKKFNSFRKNLLSKKIPGFCADCCGMSVLITKDIQNRI